jgi:hypothetical protein
MVEVAADDIKKFSRIHAALPEGHELARRLSFEPTDARVTVTCLNIGVKRGGCANCSNNSPQRQLVHTGADGVVVVILQFPNGEIVNV